MNLKREVIRKQINTGKYKSLAAIILDGIGIFFQEVTHRKKVISYLSSGFIIALITILISLLVSLIAKELHTFAKLDAILMGFWGIFMGYLSIVGFYKVIQHFLETLSRSILDSIESIADLENLENWLASTSRTRNQLIFGLCFAIIMPVFFFPVIWKILGPQYPRFGFSFIAIVSFFQVGLTASYFFPLLSFLKQLSKYKLKLFTSNPASSEVIEQSMQTLSQQSLLAASMVAFFTFGFVLFDFFRQQDILGLVIFSWVLFIYGFFDQQSVFRRIITRTKRVKLNSIQEQIERLEATQNLANKDTLEAINRLMDYHDRIKDTPNSAINLRSGLSFLNSLLLPVVGFLLGNIETVLKLFLNRRLFLT